MIDDVAELQKKEHKFSLDQYQNACSATATYPGIGTIIGLQYVTLKLAGEAGEFSEKLGKSMREDGIIRSITSNETDTMVLFGPIDEDRKYAMKKELGDILWYVARAAFELGVPLSEIAHNNIEKLSARKETGTLHGDGDNR